MDPRALANLVNAFRAFKEAFITQEPPQEGEIAFGDEDLTLWSRGGFMFLLRGDALRIYQAFVGKWDREPWISRWSSQYRIERIQDAIVAAWDKADGGAQIFEELAATFDVPPERFTVWTPLHGIDLQTNDLTIGNVRVVRLTAEHVNDLIEQVRRIAETLQNTEEQKTQWTEYVKQTVEQLTGVTCALTSTEGDFARSQELAEAECLPAVDLLQFFSGLFMDPGRRVRVDFRAFEATGYRPTLSMSEDKSHFVPNRKRFGAMGTFVVNEYVVGKLNEWGFDQLYEVYTKTSNELTEIEEFIKRAVHWFADGDLQRNQENALQSYVTCLDMFFSSRDGEATSAVQDGVAYLLGDNYEHRLSVHTFIGNVYDYRSRASHEGAPFNLPDMLSELRTLTLYLIVKMLNSREQFRTKKQLKSWVAAERLR